MFEQYLLSVTLNADTLRTTPEKLHVSTHCLQLTVLVSMDIQTNATAPGFKELCPGFQLEGQSS